MRQLYQSPGHVLKAVEAELKLRNDYRTRQTEFVAKHFPQLSQEKRAEVHKALATHFRPHREPGFEELQLARQWQHNSEYRHDPLRGNKPVGKAMEAWMRAAHPAQWAAHNARQRALEDAKKGREKRRDEWEKSQRTYYGNKVEEYRRLYEQIQDRKWPEPK